MVLFENIYINIITISIIVTIILITFFKRKYRYWKNLGVDYIEPTIPFGNNGEILKKKISMGQHYTNFYNYLRAKNIKHGGSYLFHMHIYVPIDLDLIKRIMQTDFPHFTDHGGHVDEENDPLSAHLFSLEGQKWRNLRTKLTPTFTSGKMKNMFPIMVQISLELVKVLEKKCKYGIPVDAKEVSSRYTMDIIGNCAFGIDCNSLADPNTDFRIQGKRIFDLNNRERFSHFVVFLFPKLAKMLRLKMLPKVATDFFWNVIKETTEYRQKNDFRRNDFLQLLLDMKTPENEDPKNNNTLTFSEIAAQAFVFFLAGFETSSTLMSFVLLELALNEHVQAIAREEIRIKLKQNGGELNYDSLAEMRYLDMIINETLRKYPPLPLLTRVCTKDYLVPDTNIVIKKGDPVFIPIQGIHYDPEYYPDPEKFDPTRFNDENKNKRHQFAFLPFGEGPRLCIGLRFGLMQVKVGLVSIIKNFNIKLNGKTELPLKYDPKNFLTNVLGGLWIDLEYIN